MSVWCLGSLQISMRKTNLPASDYCLQGVGGGDSSPSPPGKARGGPSLFSSLLSHLRVPTALLHHSSSNKSTPRPLRAPACLATAVSHSLASSLHPQPAAARPSARKFWLGWERSGHCSGGGPWPVPPVRSLKVLLMLFSLCFLVSLSSGEASLQPSRRLAPG